MRVSEETIRSSFSWLPITCILLSYVGDRKNSAHGHKPQGTTAVQSALSDYHAGFELGFGQPMVNLFFFWNKSQPMVNLV